MNPRDYLQTVLKVRAGSHLYNLATESSDEDYRGCVVCTHPNVLFGFNRFDQLMTKEPDMVMWNIPKFIQLALKGNTVALEVLSAPSDKVIETSEFGDWLRIHADCFYSKRIFPVLQGYGFAEFKRALGETTGRLGDKRKQDLKKFGYSPKNASHCLRLLKTGIVLFSTKEYVTSWFGPAREDLMSFKLGKPSVRCFKQVFQEHMIEMEEVFKTTKLSEKPDEKFIVEEITNFLKSFL